MSLPEQPGPSSPISLSYGPTPAAQRQKARHDRARVKMAKALAEAKRRGVLLHKILPVN